MDDNLHSPERPVSTFTLTPHACNELRLLHELAQRLVHEVKSGLSSERHIILAEASERTDIPYKHRSATAEFQEVEACLQLISELTPIAEAARPSDPAWQDNYLDLFQACKQLIANQFGEARNEAEAKIALSMMRHPEGRELMSNFTSTFMSGISLITAYQPMTTKLQTLDIYCLTSCDLRRLG